MHINLAADTFDVVTVLTIDCPCPGLKNQSTPRRCTRRGGRGVVSTMHGYNELELLFTIETHVLCCSLVFWSLSLLPLYVRYLRQVTTLDVNGGTNICWLIPVPYYCCNNLSWMNACVQIRSNRSYLNHDRWIGVKYPNDYSSPVVVCQCYL